MNTNPSIRLDDVRRLLQLCQAFDARKTDGIMENSWLQVAQIARWDRDRAAEAIRIHYSTSTDRIMPGHVTAIIKSLKPTQPTMDELRSNGTITGHPTIASSSSARALPSADEWASNCLAWFRGTQWYKRENEEHFEDLVRSGKSRFAAANAVQAAGRPMRFARPTSAA